MKDTLDDPRRSQSEKPVTAVVYKRRERQGLSKAIYKGTTRPIFLQYIQMMYNHVKNKHEINSEDMNLLLILYPIEPFTRKNILQCRKLNDHRDPSFLNKMIEKDIIYKWRPSLYEFTEKGHELMKNAHQWALGKKLIPDTITVDAMDIIRKIQRKTREALKS